MSSLPRSRALRRGCALALCLLPSLGFAITDGEETTVETAPFAVGIWKVEAGTYPELLCGGVLIAPQWVLTGAACAKPFASGTSLQNLKVVIATTNMGAPMASQNTLTVAKVFIHPELEKTTATNNNAALLKLSKSFTPSKRAGPIDLATDAETTLALTQQLNLTAVGWGSPGEELPLRSPDNNLRRIAVTLSPQSECKAKLGATSYVEATMLCVLPDRRETQRMGDMCNGDLGAPLFATHATFKTGAQFIPKTKLIGISSWGKGCARPGVPSAYASASKLAPWITSTMAANK